MAQPQALVGRGGLGLGVVVAEGVEVHRALAQQLVVARLLGELDARALELQNLPGGIVAAHLDVAEEPLVVAGVGELAPDVLGVAAVGVAHTVGDHQADLVGGVDLVGLLDGVGGAQEAVPARLLAVLLVGVGLMQTGGHVDVDVDLVDVEPVGDQALVARKDHVAEVLEGLQRVAADPAVVLVGQMQRHVEVVERDEGLDALVLAGAEDVLVELKAFLVGLGVVAVGEDAGPVDGHAVHIAAHLGHQVDVALPVAVEVGRDVAGVIGIGVDDRLGALGHVLHRGEGRARAVRHIADELAGNAVAAVAAGQRVRHSE